MVNTDTSDIKSKFSKVYGRTRQAIKFQSFLARTAESFPLGKGYRHATASTGDLKIIFDGDSEIGGHSKSETEQKRRIAVCREMYENVGIVGNMIDIMVDFALESLTIEHTSPRVRNIYVNWAKEVGLFNLCESFLKTYYRDGNVPILTVTAQVSDAELQRLRQRVFADEERTGKKLLAQLSDADVARRRIPVRYRILDVLALHKKGSDLLGTTKYQYLVSRDEVKILKAPQSPVEISAQKRFSQSMGEDAFEKFLRTGKLDIPTERLDVIHYKKDDWHKWATPMLWRISDDIKFRKLLRDMDISLAECVTNALTIIKLGNAEKGFHPSKKAYRKMIDMMKNPAKDKTIVWDDLIQIETVYPPIERMLAKEKYEQVNDDIRAGVGIPEVLLNGTAGNFANSFLSVKTLMERLETGRQLLLSWIQRQVEDVARALGFQKPAWVKMRNMSLNDEDVEKRFLLELADRNVLSARTLIERAGESFEVELQRMRDEDALREEIRKDSPFALRKLGKFGPQIQGASLAELMLLEDDTMEVDPNTMQPLRMKPKGKGLPSGQERNGQDGGRPGGTRRTRQETAPKKPVGQGKSGLALALDASEHKRRAAYQVGKLFDFLSSSVIKSKGLKGLDQLGDRDFSAIHGSIIKLICQLDGRKRIERQDIVQVLKGQFRTEAGAKLERCVRSVVEKRVQKFRERNKKEPSTEKMKDIESSAFAICKAQGLK